MHAQPFIHQNILLFGFKSYVYWSNQDGLTDFITTGAVRDTLVVPEVGGELRIDCNSGTDQMAYMTIVGWQPQRTIIHYKTEELVLTFRHHAFSI